jgi:hypothetical protein
VRAARALLRAAAATLIVATSAAHAWSPNAFEVFCGRPASSGASLIETAVEAAGARYRAEFYADGKGTGDMAGDAGCVSAARKAWIERAAASIMASYERLGFASPEGRRLGPVVTSATGSPAVRLYVHVTPDGEGGVTPGVASTLAPCLPSGEKALDRLSFVEINADIARTAATPKLYYVIAHELFHVVQNAQRFREDPGTRSCGIDGWVYEGMADAIATHLTRELFPSFDPPLGAPWVRNYVGLRPYDVNLVVDRLRRVPGGDVNAVLGYRSSSWWRHVAEVHLRGDWRYLARFTATPNGASGRDDWLRWMQRLVEGDAMIDQPHGMAYADFLTDYARWGARKYGASIGDAAWLAEAFGGCTVVPLSPRQPLRALSVELENLAGACLRVVVGGLEPDAFAAVRIVSSDLSLDELDDLHLGLAYATGTSRFTGIDADGFDCHDYLRRREVQGTNETPGFCTALPFIGSVAAPGAGGDVFSKTWRTTAQRPVAGTDAFEQRYVLSRVPFAATDARHSGRDTLSVRLQIGLEVSGLRTPATARSPRPARPGTISTAGLVERPPMGLPMSDPPLHTSANVDPTDPTAVLRVAAGLPMVAMPSEISDQLGGLTIWWGDTTKSFDDDWDFEGAFLLQLLFDDELPGGAPAFGRTGTFGAWVQGFGDGDAAGIGAGLGTLLPSMAMGGGLPALAGSPLCNYPSPDPDDPSPSYEPAARVEVVAFDAELLHVRYQGTLGYGAHDAEGRPICIDPQPFEGEIIKPFGSFFAPGGFRLVPTPGTDAELEARYGGIFAGFGSGRPPPDGDEEGAGGGGGAGGGATVCNCSCDYLIQLMDVMDEADDPAPGEMPDLEVVQAFECMQVCGMPAVMQCVMGR